MLPTKWQSIDDDDEKSVISALYSDQLTAGKNVEQFENAVCLYANIKYAVAVSSGTAALHSALFAIGIGPGDEVIVPALTFVATANAVVYLGATPVFVDINSETLSINIQEIESKITSRTKAIIAVDYAGIPCNYKFLHEITKKYSLPLVADACHSLGATYQNVKVGTLADITVFSFHPVKSITTGEGGMAVTSNKEYADKMRRFRNHNMTFDHKQRAELCDWRYDITELGFNYRITDIQCALGQSQLNKLTKLLEIRKIIADHYRKTLEKMDYLSCIPEISDIESANHFFVVKLETDHLLSHKNDIFCSLRENQIPVNVHYMPVHLFSYYRSNYNTKKGMCPIAEDAYERLLTLPITPNMKTDDMHYITEKFEHILNKFSS